MDAGVCTARLGDRPLSIEHEDSLTSAREGLEKAVDVVSRAVFETGDAYWAE